MVNDGDNDQQPLRDKIRGEKVISVWSTKYNICANLSDKWGG